MISLGFLGAAWYALLNRIISTHLALIVPPLGVITIFFLFFSFFLMVCSVRVANELGKGNAKATKLSIKVSLSTSVILGIFFCIACLAFGNKIGYWFTTDKEVAETVSDLSLLLAFSMLLNSVYPVLSGK